MPIKVLEPDVISKIAAGEVVERPASVVKELIENSLDAGATQITVEAVGGGVRLIRVSDNGIGIPADEVELAFHRYATSKVAAIPDLDAISSLGFRGEALPSIAAVTEVSMVTRSQDELAGTFIHLKNGVVMGKTKRGCAPGTTITVRNLFRDVPARLKFLKSMNTESRHIGHLVTQYSLAFPEVKFILIIEGHTVFLSPGSGNLRDVMMEVYGLDTAKSLLEMKGSAEAVIRVSGLISPPRVNRSTRTHLSFFINRRWVQSRMLAYAVEEAYRGLMMTGKHPIAAVNIFLPPQEVDVNVHPTKSEVRFRRDHEVFSAVNHEVRATLLEQVTAPTLKIHATPAPLPPAEQIPFSNIEAEEKPAPLAQEFTPAKLPVLRVLGQLQGTYIIAEGPDNMYLIDQHAAHERVLFERIREQQRQQQVEAQGLLEPVAIEFTVRQEGFLKAQQEALAEYGFVIELFGERTYLLRSVPALLKGQNVAQSLIELLDFLAAGTPSDWRERIAISLACHGAVKAGQILTHQEMQGLVQQLEQTPTPQTCPHGRPTMIQLSTSQLEKEFGRR
jgi:DNA mismatch repair protein MutL